MINKLMGFLYSICARIVSTLPQSVRRCIHYLLWLVCTEPKHKDHHFRSRKEAKPYTSSRTRMKVTWMPWMRYCSADNEINALSHSQNGQELFIIDKLFHDYRKGFFVEVGANDPIELSNSYTLEKLGWTGLAFEPIDTVREKWKGIRTTKCYPYVIGDKEGYVEFMEEEKGGVLSSVSGYGRSSEANASIGVKKQMRKLGNVLQELDVQKIDILFVDVEGFEHNVLKGIDFDRVYINCICIENHPLRKETADIRQYLNANGYRLIAHIGHDDIFVADMTEG